MYQLALHKSPSLLKPEEALGGIICPLTHYRDSEYQDQNFNISCYYIKILTLLISTYLSTRIPFQDWEDRYRST